MKRMPACENPKKKKNLNNISSYFWRNQAITSYCFCAADKRGKAADFQTMGQALAFLGRKAGRGIQFVLSDHVLGYSQPVYQPCLI